jgi:hypothetical protein
MIRKRGGRRTGGWRFIFCRKKEESSFSEEKEAKRLLFLGLGGAWGSAAQWQKFLLLFFKKEVLTSFR